MGFRATPGVAVFAAAVASVGGAVGELGFLAGRRVGVEVVVDVDAVDVVAAGDVGDDADGVGADAGITKIHPKLAAVSADSVGEAAGDVVGGVGFARGGGGSEGVEPGVELEAAAVGFGDGEGERIVTGGAALFTEEDGGPGFEVGLVEGVAGGADL